MPVYEYTAIGGGGKQQKGSIDAENLRAARQKLRAQNLFPTDMKESSVSGKAKSQDVSKYFQSDRVNTKDLSVMTRQLATLIGAGLPLVAALSALSDQTGSKTLQRIIIDIREKVEEGGALAKAMGAFPKAFPRLFVNMIASGEASGTLDAVLENLADYLEAQLELRRKVSSALFYPALMLCFCTLVVMGLLAFVVPNIVEIFQKQGATLPVPTRIMLALSHGLVSYWYLIIGGIAGVIALVQWYYRQPKGRENFDRALLKLPIIGPMYLKICTARVSRTLGTLLTSGVGLLNALEIARNLVGNVHLTRALEDARIGVSEGRSLAKELARSGFFPPLLSHMIAVGEASGKLEAMLSKAGRSYENEVSASLAGLTSLIEPLMMIVLGGIVFSIVISILLPMVDLVNLVQG